MFEKGRHRRKPRSGSRNRSPDPRPHASHPETSSSASRPTPDRPFLLYVEGARDREILGCWARRVDSGLARCIEQSSVILGGRQPARAIADFEKRGGHSAGYSGLVVLDRDDHQHGQERERDDPDGLTQGLSDAGLEMFVWSLRHIESYLLVPSAIRRMLGLAPDDRTIERFIEVEAPNGRSVPQERSLHAKRILGAGGLLSEALGAELRAGDIARAMRADELHRDVHVLLDRIGILAGRSTRGPEVVIRTPPPTPHSTGS